MSAADQAEADHLLMLLRTLASNPDMAARDEQERIVTTKLWRCAGVVSWS